MPSTNKLAIETKFTKVDTNLGLVFGWAIICKEDGVDYFDTQEHHIPEQAMLEATTEFMKSERTAMDMHMGPDAVLAGSIVMAFPMTTEVAKAFGIETSTTGLMIAMQPDDATILAKFESGEYTGFSIGGFMIESEDV